MPDWLIQLIGPIAGGCIAGIFAAGSIKAQVSSLVFTIGEVKATASRAHVRIDDHIDRHHLGAKQ